MFRFINFGFASSCTDKFATYGRIVPNPLEKNHLVFPVQNSQLMKASESRASGRHNLGIRGKGGYFRQKDWEDVKNEECVGIDIILWILVFHGQIRVKCSQGLNSSHRIYAHPLTIVSVHVPHYTHLSADHFNQVFVWLFWTQLIESILAVHNPQFASHTLRELPSPTPL